MYAVIETGGKQYRVQEGDVITIEKLKAEVGETVAFDKVLVLGEGKDVKIGTPYIDAETFLTALVSSFTGFSAASALGSAFFAAAFLGAAAPRDSILTIVYGCL